MDPSTVATEGGPREDRAISLATRMLSMENEHQFLITPWNHREHWMLLIIYPLKDYKWFLDPLGLALREEIGLTMIDAFNIYNIEKRKKGRPNGPVYKLIKAPSYENTKAPNRHRGRCLSRRLISALVAKAYYGTWN
ncbi:hypothetical protein TorRG33x02_242890 [Trema orientale]|uniref:Ulp1 protease family, C-terminal catalytic domain containing protein n=1 Tax=Trema orientale TaxID=63057 RepID=A0A2P5DSV1_TREOI|nr:hypothetical protein TorRG33x02_242890 [Trema orientale]